MLVAPTLKIHIQFTLNGHFYSEIVMAEAIEGEAKKNSGKKSMAMDAFVKALRSLPVTVADNAELDSTEMVS